MLHCTTPSDVPPTSPAYVRYVGRWFGHCTRPMRHVSDSSEVTQRCARVVRERVCSPTQCILIVCRAMWQIVVGTRQSSRTSTTSSLELVGGLNKARGASSSRPPRLRVRAGGQLGDIPAARGGLRDILRLSATVHATGRYGRAVGRFRDPGPPRQGRNPMCTRVCKRCAGGTIGCM